MDTGVLGWHWTGDKLRDGRPIPAIGETLHHTGDLAICQSGLHASESVLDALRHASGPIVHRVRLSGEMTRASDKIVARERTILWSHTCSDDLLRGFARQQARSVLHLWNAPEVVRQYLETGDKTIRAAAYASAAANAAYASAAANAAYASAAANAAAIRAAADAARAAANAAYASAAANAAANAAAAVADAAAAATYAAYAVADAAQRATRAAASQYLQGLILEAANRTEP